MTFLSFVILHPKAIIVKSSVFTSVGPLCFHHLTDSEVQGSHTHQEASQNLKKMRKCVNRGILYVRPFFLSLLSLASFLILLAKSRQQNLPKNTCPVPSFHNCLWKIFLIGMTEKLLCINNGLFTLPDPDSDPHSDSDYCTMQNFTLVQIWTLIP